ncbi:metal ABC transporter solute-binding protein, Zn/Mn family [Halalkalibacterium ligniniphilum]|uniref:metal ABC transporter solute-binding protein, Zn/Mn family n=1 Tax=Halalkalibacterium ligniniphilum TaxID=1134413 RepID=UPI000345DAE0|nr:zinc ABC transporter substrate-binding protein [Halalkalibacterium ligniniphilum]
MNIKALLFSGMLATAAFLTACGGQNEAEETNNEPVAEGGEVEEVETLEIFTTIFPLEDLTKKIGGDYVNVTNLVPVGADAHTYEPTARVMIEAAEGDAFIYNGAGLEGFADALIKAIEGEGVKIVVASEGIDLLEGNHDHGEEAYPHEEDEHGHGEEAHGHEEDEHGHEEEAHGHEEDEHGHEEEAHGHEEDEHGHEEEAHGHEEDEHGHEEEAHGHEEDEHGHEEEAHGHEEDEHGHEEEAHGHEEDEHGHEEEAHGHEEDEHGHEEEAHGHEEDEHGHEEEAHGHEEDEHGHEEEAHGHEEDEHGHEEEAHGHEEDEHGHEEEAHGHEEDEHGHEEEAHGHEEDEHGDEDAHNHDHDKDPHVWLDPILSITLAENIKNTLVELLPEQEEYFESNFADVKAELTAIDEEFQTMVNEAEKDTFIVSHAGYGYWEERYGIHQIGIAGLSPTNEPSQRQVQNIIELANENQIEYLLFEQNMTPRIAEVVRHEVGAEVEYLHNLEALVDEDVASGEDYFSLMRKNIEALRTALQ